MTIRFDQLPAERPGVTVEKGQYRALIEKAEMKTPKTDPTKPQYLNLTLAISTLDGQAKGKVYDIISESDSDYVRYKLRRFVEAMRIPITGALELKDLVKIVQGKMLLVDITMDEKSEPPRAVVDIFSNEIFYPLDEPAAAAPINAPDAVDAADEDTPFAADPAPTTSY